jgi:ABC-type Mn2+/Zn2+ transport system permease subunit
LSDDLRATLTLVWPALVASLVVALACALVGVHVVARRLVVVGVALPQVAALGIAFSFLFQGWFLLGRHDTAALLAEGVGVAILAFGARRAHLGHDALAGLLFVAAAAGTVLLAQIGHGGMEEIRHISEGDALAVHSIDLWEIGGVLGAVVVVHVVALRRLLLVSFDHETAATLGVRTWVWDTVLYATLAVVAAWGVHAVGTLFVFAFLLLPAATGLVLGRGAVSVLACATVPAVLAAGGGFVVACAWDTPPGPTCAVAALVLLAAALAVERLRRR